MVSRSRGTLPLSRDGGTGSWEITCRTVSAAVAARNGGRPVSSSYRIAPRAWISTAGPNGCGQGRQQRGGLAGRLGHARQFLGQVAPFDKFHGEVGQAVLVAHVVDLDDIGMPQT